jgi:hypothetical protein
MTALHAAKDFDSACKTLGYRAQEENPAFSTSRLKARSASLTPPRAAEK